jgi:hypothetical protein
MSDLRIHDHIESLSIWHLDEFGIFPTIFRLVHEGDIPCEKYIFYLREYSCKWMNMSELYPVLSEDTEFFSEFSLCSLERNFTIVDCSSREIDILSFESILELTNEVDIVLIIQYNHSDTTAHSSNPEYSSFSSLLNSILTERHPWILVDFTRRDEGEWIGHISIIE